MQKMTSYFVFLSCFSVGILDKTKLMHFFSLQMITEKEQTCKPLTQMMTNIIKTELILYSERSCSHGAAVKTNILLFA